MPPPLPAAVPRFHRVPPAIFPPVLGLLGLASAWQNAAAQIGAPLPLAELISGMVALLFLYCAAFYAVKVILRRGALVEDARTLPGRSGLAALALCFLVLAALLARRSEGLATLSLATGFFGLLGLALWVLPQRLSGTDTAGPITPTMHLVFVGFILAPMSAVPLGIAGPLMPWLIWYCIFAAVAVGALTMRPLFTGAGAPPLRPLQTIQLAPPAFVAVGACLTGQTTLAAAALVWAALTALVLLFRLRWMTEGPFSGFWSAFTFPVTAFASALMVGYGTLGGEILRWAGGLILVAATLYIPVIAFKVLKLWATGMLAAKTNASTV